MKKKNRFLLVIALTLVLPATLMLLVSMSGLNRNALSARPEGPCDIYNAAGFPCVAAHSTTRALLKSYNGPLYQVKRQSDGKTLDIGIVQPSDNDAGGYADASAQDVFCANTLCWITTIYDQSGNNNHFLQAPPGTFVGPEKGGFNTLPIADMAPITIMGHKAYGTYIIPGMGLRNNDAKGLAINDEPEGIYMVVDGKHFDSGCCFNYGNTSTNSRAVGRATMSTVYFGTSTAWGSGNGPGPWIMSDMEAGLFSGYNTKQNVENPTIDSWRFVTGMVNGGGGNLWEIRGGNAQEGSLSTFYKGVRPQSKENSNYFPMHRKGSIQLGNGGDNGNGSAGTFYEGVVTKGYPSDAAVQAVQANIVSAKYDVQRVSLSRLITFTPGLSQEITLTFTNTTGTPVSNVKLNVDLPSGWVAVVSGSNEKTKIFSETIAPGASAKAVFKITSPTATGAGYLTGKAEWKSPKSGGVQSESSAQRIRNTFPVKINEVRFNTSTNPSNQFIELYNASAKEVDISNWTLMNTRSEWASVKLATIPEGAKIAPKGFYVLGLAGSGLAAPAKKGEPVINVLDAEGFEAGQQITIGGEICKIKSVGTAASPMTMIYVPVPVLPWLTIPAGATNLPVVNAAGFQVGQKIGIDLGGNYEIATVTAVGKAATMTNLSVEAKAGETIIKVLANSNMTVGDILTIGNGARKETAKVKRLINVVAAPTRGGFGQGAPAAGSPGEIELDAPLKFDHMLDVDVITPGTGITFTPATRFIHKSADAIQALGSGVTLESVLEKNHETGEAVLNPKTTKGYQGTPAPDLWYGAPLSSSAGSIALMDAGGSLVADAMVYGSQQSNSSANGTVASPDLATLEGVQTQGGCIVVVPGSGRGLPPSAQASGEINRSFGRYPDGADADSNCEDFLLQSSVPLLLPAAAGSNNLKVANMAGLGVGQKIIVGSGANSETATIASLGTTGGSTLSAEAGTGANVILVASAEGFATGQAFTIGAGGKSEKAVIASIATARRRFGSAGAPADTITVTSPLKSTYAIGTEVSGSGVTLAAPLAKAHDKGVLLVSSVPTPGMPNQYARKP